MFEQSLVESMHHFEARRGWSTLAATVLQSLAMALLILLPLMQMQKMVATTERISPPTIIATSPPQTVPPAHGANASDAANAATPIFQEPSVVPPRISTGPDATPPSIPLGSLCVTNCVPSLAPLTGTGSSPVLQSEAAHGPLIISHPDPAQILRQVQPVYPPIAKAAGIEGTVVLRAVISRGGRRGKSGSHQRTSGAGASRDPGGGTMEIPPVFPKRNSGGSANANYRQVPPQPRINMRV